jgi:hypothetical protein
MIRRTMEFESEDELIAAEQAIAMARELKKLADAGGASPSRSAGHSRPQSTPIPRTDDRRRRSPENMPRISYAGPAWAARER